MCSTHNGQPALADENSPIATSLRALCRSPVFVRGALEKKMENVRDFCQDSEIEIDLSVFYTWSNFLISFISFTQVLFSKGSLLLTFWVPISRLGNFGTSDIALLGGEQA